MSDLSNRILSLIEEKGLSYGELSELTKIPKSAIQRYATGETEKIPLPRIEALADALGVSSAYLIGWGEEPSFRPFENLFLHAEKDQPSETEGLSDIAIQIARLVNRFPPESQELVLHRLQALEQALQALDDVPKSE